MSQISNHPTMQEIMDFVSLSRETLNAPGLSRYFSMVRHFVDCEQCRKLKDQMIEFSEKFEDVFSKLPGDGTLQFKVYHSLEALNVSEEWNCNDILWTAKGKISKCAGESAIQSIAFDSEYFNKMQLEGEQYEEYAVTADSSRICLGNEKISVFLHDDGRQKHSLLMIPERQDNTPIMCSMTKEADTWRADCDCPEDDYDIVIF